MHTHKYTHTLKHTYETCALRPLNCDDKWWQFTSGRHRFCKDFFQRGRGRWWLGWLLFFWGGFFLLAFNGFFRGWGGGGNPEQPVGRFGCEARGEDEGDATIPVQKMESQQLVFPCTHKYI
jgi:hypothetical protein